MLILSPWKKQSFWNVKLYYPLPRILWNSSMSYFFYIFLFFDDTSTRRPDNIFLESAFVRNSNNNNLLKIVIIHYLQTLLTNSRILADYLAKSFGKFDARKRALTRSVINFDIFIINKIIWEIVWESYRTIVM